MYKKTNVERKRRVGFTSVVLAAMVTGGSFGHAPAAVGAPDALSPDLAIAAASPAAPGVPDVGEPGEGSGQQLVPTIDPQGNPVWPTRDDPAATIHNAATRGDWTDVVAVVDGARIRTRPVDGTVVGLISKGAYFYINCQTRASDGYVWGYARHQRRYGWVRRDLWEVVRYTAPNASSPRPIPWC